MERPIIGITTIRSKGWVIINQVNKVIIAKKHRKGIIEITNSRMSLSVNLNASFSRSKSIASSFQSLLIIAK
jgi:hypothetical protein